MQQQQKCATCECSFTSTNIARILPNCGHNICTNCLKTFIAKQAPTFTCRPCNQDYPLEESDIQSFPKNIAIIKHLREASSNPSMLTQPQPLSELEPSNRSEGIGELGDVSNSGSLLLESVAPLRATLDKCTQHGKPMDIICTVDKDLLCSHCALFGEHRSHELKTLEQFETDSEIMKKRFEQLQARKMKSENSIKGKEYRCEIVAQVKRKKDDLIVEIRKHFSELMQLVKDAETKIYDELVQAFRNIDASISKAVKEEQNLEACYMKWLKNAENNISAIYNSTDIHEKISRVYDPSINFKQGQTAVCEIEEKNRNTKETIKSMIESIRMEYSVSLEGHIYNYARVNFTPLEQTPDKLIDMAPHNKEHKIDNFYNRRPIRPEFVKSEIIFHPPEESKSEKEINARTIIKSPTRSGISSPSNRFKPVAKDSNRKVMPKQSKSPSSSKFIGNLDFAERNLNEFRKSTETLDLTGCDLSDNEILHVVSIAAGEKPIKCMKVAKNKLTNGGLARMLQHLQFVTSINVSNNLLSDEAVDEFIQRREIVPNLRIINFSNNKLNERKVKSKIEELKRMGIIATL